VDEHGEQWYNYLDWANGGEIMYKMDGFIDISVPLGSRTVTWPGDPPYSASAVLELERDGCAVSGLALTTHSGTHIDAPSHFFAGGATVDQVPLQLLCGPVLVAEVFSAGEIGVEELSGLSFCGVERLIFKTANSGAYPEARPQEPVTLSVEAARYLVERTSVRLVGIDWLSIEAEESVDHLVHKVLLGAASPMVILEGLDLRATAAGSYELICMPLRVEGLDGAPARVVLRG